MEIADGFRVQLGHIQKVEQAIHGHTGLRKTGNDHREGVGGETKDVEQRDRGKGLVGGEDPPESDVGGKGHHRYKKRGRGPEEPSHSLHQRGISESGQLLTSHSFDFVEEALFPGIQLDHLDPVENLVEELQAIIFNPHLDGLEPTHLLRDHPVDRNQNNHQKETSKNRGPEDLVQEEEGESDLHRSRPHHMEVGNQVLETLGIHRHQVHDRSLGASLSGTDAKTEGLIVHSHNRRGTQVHTDAKTPLKILVKDGCLSEIGQTKPKTNRVSHPRWLFGVSNKLDEFAQPQGAKEHKQIVGKLEEPTVIEGEGVGLSQGTDQRPVGQTRLRHFFLPVADKVLVQHVGSILLGQLPQIFGGKGSLGTELQNGGHPGEDNLREETSGLFSAQPVLFDRRRGGLTQEDTNHHLRSDQNIVSEEPTELLEPSFERHQSGVVVELATVGEEVGDQEDGQSPPKGTERLLLLHHVQEIGDKKPRKGDRHNRNHLRAGDSLVRSQHGEVLNDRKESQKEDQRDLEELKAVPGLLSKEPLEFIDFIRSTLLVGAFDFVVTTPTRTTLAATDEEQGGDPSDKQIQNREDNQEGIEKALPKIKVLPNRVK